MWENPNRDEYPGVKRLALRIKEAILQAHDAIISARVKQTRQANKKRQDAPFKVGDLVYLSTKNINLPKGRSRKLAPKYIGPYRIEKELESGASFALELPNELRAREVHNAFHASLLRVHVPNDDRRFPGRQLENFSADMGTNVKEWDVDRILSHTGTGKNAQFELKWKNGDITWEPYHVIKNLVQLEEYCDLMRIEDTRQFGESIGTRSRGDQGETIPVNCVRFKFSQRSYKSKSKGYRYPKQQLNAMQLTFYTPFSSLNSILEWEAAQRIPRNVDFFSTCSQYGKSLRKYLDGERTIPGAIPIGYITFASLVKNEAVAPLPNFAFAAPTADTIRMAFGHQSTPHNRVFIGDHTGTKVFSFEKDEELKWLYFPSHGLPQFSRPTEISSTKPFTISSSLHHPQPSRIMGIAQAAEEVSSRRPPTPYPHAEITALRTTAAERRRAGSTTPTQRTFKDDISKHPILSDQLRLKFTKNKPIVFHHPQPVAFRRLRLHQHNPDGYQIATMPSAWRERESSSPVRTHHRVSVLPPIEDSQSGRLGNWRKDRRGSRGRGRGKKEAVDKRERRNWRRQEKSDAARCVPAGRRRASVTNMDLPFPRARFPAEHSFMAIHRI